MRVYARYISSEILWGSKVKKFLGHFWLGIFNDFVQDNLPVNLKQEVWPISQLLPGTELKNDQFSRLKVYIKKRAGCCFFCAFMQGQTMLKKFMVAQKQGSIWNYETKLMACKQAARETSSWI